LLRHSSFDTSSYDSLAIVSRLAAAEHPESRALMTSALREAYRLGLRNGIEVAVAATRRYLVPFFGRFGWVPSGQIYEEAIAGEMHVLALHLRNRAHLQVTHSILLELLEEFESDETMEMSA
jgi:predicted GNAT family N-acyltransferase